MLLPDCFMLLNGIKWKLQAGRITLAYLLQIGVSFSASTGEESGKK
jgi:hypothetical protein